MKNSSLGVKTTFTPLRRNRLKCNQTGEIVKRGRTKALENARFASRNSNYTFKREK